MSDYLVLIIVLTLVWLYSPRLFPITMERTPLLFLLGTIPSYVVAFALMTIIWTLTQINQFINGLFKVVIELLMRLTLEFRKGIFGK